MNSEDRFWSKVDRSGDVDSCWPWQAGKNERGYGLFWLRDRNVMAHRYAYELTYGPLPEGMLACHRCDNPPCCNPAHLFAGTYADNAHDRDQKGRHNPAEGSAHGSATLTDDLVRSMKIRYAQGGISQRELARLYNVTTQTVSSIMVGRYWDHVVVDVDIPQRTDRMWSKLTETQVHEIRRRYAYKKVSMRLLAREYNVSVQTICNIIRKRSWRTT